MDGELTYQAWAMTETAELKPCPFCGGEAEVYEMQYGADGQYSVFGVFCVDDSKAELIGLSKYQHGHFIDNFPTEAEAIEAWNTRAPMSYEDLKILLDELGVSERVCDITILRAYDGEEVARYCGCGCLLELEDNYCPNCGAKVVSE